MDMLLTWGKGNGGPERLLLQIVYLLCRGYDPGFSSVTNVLMETFYLKKKTENIDLKW